MPETGEQPPSPPRGRSLTGFYIAVGVLAALIALGAALWKPLRAWYHEPYESWNIFDRVVSRCRYYVEAQALYRAKDWDKDGKLEYAHPFALLCSTEDAGEPIQLIDPSFALADGLGNSYPATGYYFRDCQTIGGVAIDWEQDFALCAFPMVYDRTGYRTFIVKTDGVVWAKDLGRSEPVKDFPADPAREGWRVVR
jgi:hypothetical protein